MPLMRILFAGYLLLALPIHGILYLLTIRDPRFVDILAVKFKKCLPTPNKRFWGGNSYSPDTVAEG